MELMVVSERVMEKIAPLGPTYQAGTTAGNPLSIAAGTACLHVLSQPGTYPRLDLLGQTLADAIQDLAHQYSLPVQINRQGGAFALYFTEEPIIDYASAQSADDQLLRSPFSFAVE